MTSQAVRLSSEDNAYIRSHFVTLELLAEKSGVSPLVLAKWREESLFPRPTYVTEDGQEWYPPAYAELVHRAASRKLDLRALFRSDFLRALEKLRRSDPDGYRAELGGPGGTELSPEADAELSWEGFMSGEFGACLRMAWVPCVLRKGKLMREIEGLVTKPEVDNPKWRDRLRRSVDSLDRLEMPFAQWDRVRFGKPVSRDTHVTAVRLRFPEVFRFTSERPQDRPTSAGPFSSDEMPC
ncbi:MAG: DUF6058 family natural product biosynthesis protein [Thermoplasmata archaeon]